MNNWTFQGGAAGKRSSSFEVGAEGTNITFQAGEPNEYGDPGGTVWFIDSKKNKINVEQLLQLETRIQKLEDNMTRIWNHQNRIRSSSNVLPIKQPFNVKK